VQQYPEAFAASDPQSLPAREALPSRALRIWCLQVVADEGYRGRGLATGMVRRLIAWAQAEGWAEIRAQAILPIPPLLDWTGLFSREAYARLGFEARGGAASPELLEGVRHMRAGGHSEQVRKQWEPFAHLSDEAAATLHDMVLPLQPL